MLTEVKGKIMSYHRATANESERTNMTELMNNNSPCSVSIILHMKCNYISDSACRMELTEVCILTYTHRFYFYEKQAKGTFKYRN